jgi:predicted RNA methylase
LSAHWSLLPTELYDPALQGMLAIGAALLGSPCVIGLDVDADALEVAQDNCEQFEDPLPVSEMSGCVLRDSLKTGQHTR